VDLDRAAGALHALAADGDVPARPALGLQGRESHGQHDVQVCTLPDEEEPRTPKPLVGLA